MRGIAPLEMGYNFLDDCYDKGASSMQRILGMVATTA